MFQNTHEYPLNTIFVIDFNLDDSENGLFISRTLFAMGYKNLYLFSGEEINEDEYFWLKGTISKTTPQKIVTLKA